MSMKPHHLLRYSALDRANHWLTALSFTVLALSGLALFHPSMFWLTQWFGGGVWARILHPYVGVLMFLSFLGLCLRFWHHNLLSVHDVQWLRQITDVVRNREDRLPEVDRYNAGQKLLFWTLLLVVPALLVSGVLIWRPWFAPAFSIETVRWGALLHAVSAFVMISSITVHIYAAFWVRGTLGAMLRGTVSRAWAAKHHAVWYKRVLRGEDH